MDKNFILVIGITICLTALIVWGLSWIDKSKEKYPTLYKYRQVIRSVIWLILNSTGIK